MPILPLILAAALVPAPQDHRGARFIGFRALGSFAVSECQVPGAVLMTSREIDPELPWDELVVSWNAEMPPETWLKIEARGVYPDRATRHYTLGLWSADPARHPRESVNGQADADGDVKTDTLVLRRPGARVQLRLTLGGPTDLPDPPRPRLKFLGLAFRDTSARPAPLPPHKEAWGRVLEVPERSQLDYPDGRGWCSPTATSMVLAWWARRLNRPELDVDVPQVAREVHDPGWPGTGNWPFNTAFAGALPGMRAFVARLTDLSEVEQWTASGVPVVLSVLPSLLHGTDSASSGHLVVCAGFNEAGDAVVNDPWARRERGQRVRRVYARDRLAAAWAASRHTVYLIFPEGHRVPRDGFGHWSIGERD